MSSKLTKICTVFTSLPPQKAALALSVVFFAPSIWKIATTRFSDVVSYIDEGHIWAVVVLITSILAIIAYFLPSNKPGMIAKMYFVCLILNGMKTLKTCFSIAMFAEVALFSAFQWLLWLSYLDQKEQETFKKVSTTVKSKSCADLNESAAPMVPV